MKTVVIIIPAPGRKPVALDRVGFLSFEDGARVFHDFQASVVLKAGQELRFRRVKDSIIVTAAWRKKREPKMRAAIGP